MKKKKKKSISEQGIQSQSFRRRVHGSKNLRQGLSIARANASPEHFPRIVRQLSRSPVYESLLAPMTFPMSLSAITPKVRLGAISTDGELLWCASVLSLYAQKLRAYVKLRDNYYSAYVNAEYEQAAQIIQEIQETFGFSLWLLRNRIQLLQLTKGLQAQKTFLEEFVSIEGVNQFIAWNMYFLSLRAEDNISYSSFKLETKEAIDLSWLHDYAVFHWLPTDFTLIINSGSPISVEEPHPIIDRFETFVAMSLHYCVKNGVGNNKLLITALELINDVDDKTVNHLLMTLRDGYTSIETKVLPFADAYTEGRYEEVINSHCDSLELVARAYALLGRRPSIQGGMSLRQQAISLMFDVLSLSSDAPQSKLKLKKLALLCPESSFGFQISGFLNRTYEDVVSGGTSDMDLVVALSGALDNPWCTTALDSVCIGDQWIHQLLKFHSNSTALKLRQSLITSNVENLLSNLYSLPYYRQAMYIGHIHLRAKDYSAAASKYLLASESSIEYVSHTAKRYLFDAYYLNDQLYDAVQLVIDQILKTPSAAYSYPLEDLARKYLVHGSYRNSIDLALLLHFATRYSNANFERDISNIYENILAHEGGSRPTELIDSLEQFKIDRLVYFLRHVCVPRILDDTTCFDTVDDIDFERISICQALMRLDPNNLATYQAEIRVITRSGEVAHLLSKMQTSKIYVDESGVRESLEISLNDSLIRYRQLLNSPSLAYQTEKLTKRLSEMLSTKEHPEFKDLKLPASELEGLFNAIFIEVISEFALSPAFGLDTHVSTSIRHGAFEGHLRSPLAIEDLLCLKKDKEYLLPAAWRKKLPDVQDDDFAVLQKALTFPRFFVFQGTGFMLPVFPVADG